MATFTVTNLNDAGAGSLRQAFDDANNAAGADTIEFDAALNGTITLGGTALVSTDALTIAGTGADKITINAQRNSRIFEFKAGGTISGLTITEGSAAGGSAIRASGAALTLDRVHVSSSSGQEAGVFAANVALTVTNSSFAYLVSGEYGGAIGASNAAVTVSISNSTFRQNGVEGGGPGSGGAIGLTNGPILNVSSSTFIDNYSDIGGGAGAIYVQNGGTITNSVFFSAGPANAGITNTASGAAVLNVSYSLLAGTNTGVTFGAGNITGAPATGYTPPAATTVAGLTTFVPVLGSAVVNVGDPAYTTATVPTTDQRGLARVSGGRIDMGAAELQQVVVVPPPPAADSTLAPPPPPPTVAPTVNTNAGSVLGRPGTGVNAPPATVTTPNGQVLPNPILEQQKAIAALIARVDAGTLTLRAAQDIIVDMADGTTSVATMSYQFFTGKLPTKAGLDYLVSSPENPRDLNDGYYAGMSLENRYINFAVNLGKPPGEGAAAFAAGYGPLSLSDATAKAYLEVFGRPADAGKVTAILTPERSAYFNILGGDALGAKAAMVGFLLGEAAKTDAAPYAANNENFLYDLLDGNAAFGASAGIYLNAGPITVGLVGMAEA